MRSKILKPEFFERPVVKVAEDLLGKYLVKADENGVSKAFMITETESYDGEKDLACHASKGRTKRTEVMYGEAGRFYVYLCYGMYWMLNVVTGQKDYPAAVLIRGIEGCGGPGKLTKALQIDKRVNGEKSGKSAGLWFEDRGVVVSKKRIKKKPRVGIAYAGDVWAKKPWRFLLGP